MPAGVSWGEYLRHSAAALLAMFAGAQAVHVFYRPLQDMDKLVEEEKKRLVQVTQDSKQKEQSESEGKDS